MIYCGIDLHANNMVNVAINSNGKVVREAKLPTSRRSLEDFFGSFEGRESAERLMAVPGLGKVGAWTILAEIGDITRFLSAKQFTSYCRLVPGAKDSGGARRHTSGNKDGKRYLRAAFGQAAVSGYTHYKVVKKFYRKIKRRSGRPIARAVVAKELAKGVWHMLTKDEEYKGFKGQPVRAASQTCWPQPISPFA